MTRLVDLTDTIDPAIRDVLPDFFRDKASFFAPTIKYMPPESVEAKELFCSTFGCSHSDLPHGDAWGGEWLMDLTTHTGTHVDAPMHSGEFSEGKKARTITDIPIEELFVPGVVLDVRPWAERGKEITIDMLDQARNAAGVVIENGSAVLIRTGQEKYTAKDPEYFQQPGMSRRSTLHLIEQGAKVLGTDGLGWDLPFNVMTEKFQKTRDKEVLWDGHKAIVEREAFIVQQMVNLGSLPPAGFMVGFFPIKLAKCSAAPARVIAFLD